MFSGMETPPSIIVVDDEPDLREAVGTYLTRRGFDVRLAADAVALRTALAERHAACILLDLSMPGEDGLTVARALRAAGDPVGIIMLTAASEVVDRVVGLEVGADDYLGKPVDLRELLARLRAVLRRGAAMAASPPLLPVAKGQRVRMGGNWLDLEHRRLFGRDGAEIPLATSEFALLEAFATRPGRVLSRETLLDLAHPHGEEHFDRSIDVRITRIRRKIEATPAQPQVIRTVRGLGYRFDPDADG